MTITLVIVLKKNFSCGKRIRELRTERGLTQERLALNAGITPAYLGLLERDQRNATVVTIERICAALNISMSEFFSTAEPAEPVEDDLGKQILYQMNGMNDAEKSVILQRVKTVMHLRQLGIEQDQK